MAGLAEENVIPGKFWHPFQAGFHQFHHCVGDPNTIQIVSQIVSHTHFRWTGFTAHVVSEFVDASSFIRNFKSPIVRICLHYLLNSQYVSPLDICYHLTIFSSLVFPCGIHWYLQSSNLTIYRDHIHLICTRINYKFRINTFIILYHLYHVNPWCLLYQLSH
jgi:hypothetical protein